MALHHPQRFVVVEVEVAAVTQLVADHGAVVVNTAVEREVDTRRVHHAAERAPAGELDVVARSRRSPGNDAVGMHDELEVAGGGGAVDEAPARQVHIAGHEIHTPGDNPDVLVAMNPASLKVNSARWLYVSVTSAASCFWW